MFSTSTKVATCLLAPACVALGGDVFSRYETGLVGVQPTNAEDEVENISYSLVVAMLLADTIIYALLAWYISQVRPNFRNTSRSFDHRCSTCVVRSTADHWPRSSPFLLSLLPALMVRPSSQASSRPRSRQSAERGRSATCTQAATRRAAVSACRACL